MSVTIEEVANKINYLATQDESTDGSHRLLQLLNNTGNGRPGRTCLDLINSLFISEDKMLIVFPTVKDPTGTDLHRAIVVPAKSKDFA